MHVEAPMPAQAALHLGMFVGCVVSHEEMHFPVCRCLRLEESQQAQPFLRPGRAPAGSEDLPVESVESRKQPGRALSFVIVGPRLA